MSFRERTTENIDSQSIGNLIYPSVFPSQIYKLFSCAQVTRRIPGYDPRAISGKRPHGTDSSTGPFPEFSPVHGSLDRSPNPEVTRACLAVARSAYIESVQSAMRFQDGRASLTLASLEDFLPHPRPTFPPLRLEAPIAARQELRLPIYLGYATKR